jgi:hypothetical protein
MQANLVVGGAANDSDDDLQILEAAGFVTPLLAHPRQRAQMRVASAGNLQQPPVCQFLIQDFTPGALEPNP